MMETIWEDIKKEASLVSLPEVYLRLRAILDEPDFAMAEVAVVISQDPSITLRLLRIVNSSLYSFATKIETVSHAVAMLGTQQVHDLVLATSVAQAFRGISTDIMDMRRFWKRSIYCAVASRKLSTFCSTCDKERLFVAGLLHDIGHLLMYQALPELSQGAILSSKESGEPLCKVEQAVFGFDYGWAGAELMKEWSIPESLTDIIRFHVEPEKAKIVSLEAALVHLGSMIARTINGEGVLNEDALAVEPFSWSVSGLSVEDCSSLYEEIEEEAEETIHLILP